MRILERLSLPELRYECRKELGLSSTGGRRVPALAKAKRRIWKGMDATKIRKGRILGYHKKKKTWGWSEEQAKIPAFELFGLWAQDG